MVEMEEFKLSGERSPRLEEMIPAHVVVGKI